MIVGEPMMKQSAEKWPWSVDFTSVLETNDPAETISAATFSAVARADGSDATVALQADDPAISGAVVSVELKDGEDNADYTLQLRITTDRGHVWDAERVLAVRDI
jgi:hypothetical protein